MTNDALTPLNRGITTSGVPVMPDQSITYEVGAFNVRTHHNLFRDTRVAGTRSKQVGALS